ncbi:MAG: VWA domain-containing protein, partial [Candidatus Magnetoovum sp. WYHC-5]|nr:VWA domain-containing protein [Candidatus Magnetoovum sp. WYHC-5]
PVEGAQDNIFLDITNISSAKDGSVSMTISALDEKGVPIRGIEKEALSLYVDSKGVDSFSVEPVSDSPLSVMMFLDISGSMEGQSIFDAKRGISYLLNRLGANDFVSLVTFGDDVKGVVPFTQKKDVIESGLDSVKAGDKKTKLYQALSYALYLASRSYYTSRNVIVMFTDGKDEGSTVTSEELISSIKTVNIPVYVFGFGDEVAKEFLKKVAYTSHGGLFLSPSYDDFTKVGDTVLEQKRGKFNVVFDLKLPTDKYVATVKLGYNGKEAKAEIVIDTLPSFAELIFVMSKNMLSCAPSTGDNIKRFKKRLSVNNILLITNLLHVIPGCSLALVLTFLWIEKTNTSDSLSIPVS